MIDEELKAILACPACKGDLLFEETRIICPACRKAYPIRDGIPVMLISEAEFEPEVISRLQSLRAATLTHQQHTQERKARVMALAVPIKTQHPDWSDSRIAEQIHQELKLEMEREADISPELRTIRRYLREL